MLTAQEVLNLLINMKLIASGQKDVTTAGTAQILIDTTTETKSIVIKAKSGNSGNIYIGKSDVNNNAGFIGPGENIALDVNNAKEPIYIDADISGNGVCFWALN